MFCWRGIFSLDVEDINDVFKKIGNKIEHVIVNALMTHLCCEDFNGQLHYQQEANWCQVILNRSG